ncbi:MAG TPA: sugar nucleotide-binding protein [Xanthobacteraceae bacterium]|jgi:dTDP-4-dehydrorhamnose reductase
MRSIVIGADGVVGGALVRVLSSRGDLTYRTTRRPAASLDGCIRLDLASVDVDAITLPDVDIAFFCAAIASFSECRSNFDLARRVNVMGPVAIARRLAAAGTQVVLLSTSAVFDWSVPCVDAGREPCPITAYGRLKAEAEAEFTNLGELATILRLTKVLTPDNKLLNGWLEQLRRGRALSAYSDHHMAPVTLDDTIAGLLAISDNSAAGLFQLSGARDISYFEAARHLAWIAGVRSDLVTAARASDGGLPAEEIIRFSSLDTSRMEALTGWKAPDPCSVLNSLFPIG